MFIYFGLYPIWKPPWKVTGRRGHLAVPVPPWHWSLNEIIFDTSLRLMQLMSHHMPFDLFHFGKAIKFYCLAWPLLDTSYGALWQWPSQPDVYLSCYLQFRHVLLLYIFLRVLSDFRVKQDVACLLFPFHYVHFSYAVIRFKPHINVLLNINDQL